MNCVNLVYIVSQILYKEITGSNNEPGKLDQWKAVPVILFRGQYLNESIGFLVVISNKVVR